MLCNKMIHFTQDLALNINKLHIDLAENNFKFAEFKGEKWSSLSVSQR